MKNIAEVCLAVEGAKPPNSVHATETALICTRVFMPLLLCGFLVL